MADQCQHFRKNLNKVTANKAINLLLSYIHFYSEVRGSGKCLDCSLHSSVSVAICAAVLVCVSSGLRDVCCVPVWPVLHSSFSHPKADVIGTMGSGRLLWRPTGGRLKVSPPRSAQQMEAEVIIYCSLHLLTPQSSMPSLTLTASLYCKQISVQLWCG